VKFSETSTLILPNAHALDGFNRPSLDLPEVLFPQPKSTLLSCIGLSSYFDFVKSTSEYCDEFSSNYVKFYEIWSYREGEFSNPKYREGYKTVANILNKTAASGEKVIDVGCGVRVWSTLLVGKGVCVTSVDNLLSMLQRLAVRTKKFGAESKISPVSSDGFQLPV